jgi:hypothetical protein
MKMKQLLMTAVSILGLATFNFGQTVPSYVPSNGLVGWWPFSGNANDESGNGNTGTVYAAALTEDRFGVTNNSFIFEDTPDKIKVVGNVELQLANTFTITSWVKPLNNTYGSGPNYHAIVEKWGISGDASYLFALTPEGKPLMVSHNGNNFFLNTNTTIPFDNWTFLVYTQDDNIGSIYINGVLDTTSNNMATPQPNNNPLLFASNDSYNQDWIGDAYEGTLDDIGIWNRALTQEEITSLYFGSSVGVNEVSQSNLFSVFPNPAQSEINVKLDAKLLGSEFTINNNIGKAVKTGKLNSENTTIELNDLPGGIYTFSVGENKKQSFKVIKE